MSSRHFLFIYLFFIYSCEKNYTPKPRGYFRIDFPKKEYQIYNSNCPFSFEYPTYSTISIDTDLNSEPCWLNLDFQKFKGRLHISYKVLKNDLQKFSEDSRTLAYKHSLKASGITETEIHTPNHVYGILYNIEGNAASSIQFFVTDSTKHFLRASMYFNVQPNFDSLAPVVQFISYDINKMINTIKWK